VVVVKEGLLEKRGAWSRAWKARLVVLANDGVLCFFHRRWRRPAARGCVPGRRFARKWQCGRRFGGGSRVLAGLDRGAGAGADERLRGIIVEGAGREARRDAAAGGTLTLAQFQLTASCGERKPDAR
jgi:hypothetical protein